MSQALDIDAIDLAYPGTPGSQEKYHYVVRQFSLHLHAGELACLLGPSGCGKSSLLRAVAGFEPLLAGRIVLGGRVLSDPHTCVAPEHRGVGMMFQDYALFPHLDVADNVGFGLRTMPRRQRHERIMEMLHLVGLQDLAQRHIHQLSGGQQQRIALARALAPAPALLLLDEPFSNLDNDTRVRLVSDVRDILKRTGQTALMVTHHEQEAQIMADQHARHMPMLAPARPNEI